MGEHNLFTRVSNNEKPDRETPAKQRGTSTSNFGAGKRESHDSSAFYRRFRAPVISNDDHVAPALPVANPFVLGDARHMDAIADNSVALVVTSPPYFVGKQYEEELARDGIPSTYLEYLEMLRDVFAECVRKLEPGGRLAINVANLGRKPYRSLSSDIIRMFEDDLGLLLRAELIWQKAEGASGSCAWGSFRSAANPVIRDVTERIIVASKGRFDRAQPPKVRAAKGLPHKNTLPADDFMSLTLDLWQVPPESATRVGHPAPFPIELPEALIRLYTYEDDLVLDPFMGSGSTLVAAARLDRRYIGYDLDPSYVELAQRRVADATVSAAQQQEQSAHHALSAISNNPTGASAMNLAKSTLEEAGFSITHTNRRIPKTGVRVSFVATDKNHQTWYFEVAGTAASTRGGMLPNDVVWRSLGRAHALRGADPLTPLVILTTQLPKARSEGSQALLAAGPKAFFDLITLGDQPSSERLAKYASGHHYQQPLTGFWSDAELSAAILQG